MYSMKEVTVCDNKKIYVFDNLFTYTEKEFFYSFMTTQTVYRINSGSALNDDECSVISSFYDESDIVNLGLYKTKGYKIVDDMFNLSSREKKQRRINCINSFTKNIPHTDSAGLTFLYYANLEWKIHWSGHTCFLNESISEIEYTSVYKPGRLIIFDGTIPHMITAPNKESKGYRISFAIQYT